MKDAPRADGYPMKKIGDMLADKLKGIQKRAAAKAQAEGQAATVTPIKSRMIER